MTRRATDALSLRTLPPADSLLHTTPPISEQRARIERERIVGIIRAHFARYPQGSPAGLAIRALLADVERSDASS
jgi:hypothetical protein